MAQGRASLIVVPREHGAWVMLTVPYIVGASIAGSFSGEEIAGLVGVLMLFFSRASLALLWKSRVMDGSFGRDSLIYWLNFTFFAAVGSSIFLYFIYAGGLWHLFAVAALGLGLWFGHEWLVWRRRERSVSAELVGVALLTLTAPASVIISGCDSCERLAVILWLLSAMYFGASVFYVKMRLKTASRRRKPGSMRGRFIAAKSSIVYMAAALVVLIVMLQARLIPLGAVAAFIPMFCYQSWGISSGAGAMTLKAEGLVQTVLSVAFALILIGAYGI